MVTIMCFKLGQSMDSMDGIDKEITDAKTDCSYIMGIMITVADPHTFC